ncbi:Alpha/Beta hydrolase protein [Kalaharituber pfeilii]|nr:Alpha/Beta hydrolase protein [Kalaharituber pfeilii]
MFNHRSSSSPPSFPRSSTNSSAPRLKMTNRTRLGLFFQEHNPAGTETIVLLHGMYGSHAEFTNVDILGMSGSDKWHVLIPDLPGHGRSKGLEGIWEEIETDLDSSGGGSGNRKDEEEDKFEVVHEMEGEEAKKWKKEREELKNKNIFELTLHHIVHLIQYHAKVPLNNSASAAHLAGVSYGGYISLLLATQHPDVVLTITTTGAGNPLPQYFATVATVMLCGLLRPLAYFPGVFAQAMKGSLEGTEPPEELLQDMIENVTGGGWFGARGMTEVSKRAYRGYEGDGESVEGWGRTKRRGGQARVNEKCRVMVARGMVHTWDMQAPDVFAKMVVGWIERGEEGLPEELVGWEKWVEEKETEKRKQGWWRFW